MDRNIKNSFAPLHQGRFEYVVGNPPWINWDALPNDYRDSTRKLWKDSGLIREIKKSALGKIRRDIATLFVVRCYDQYLSKSGKLAFLIPFNIIKTEGADGFRLFLTNKTNVLIT